MDSSGLDGGGGLGGEDGVEVGSCVCEFFASEPDVVEDGVVVTGDAVRDACVEELVETFVGKGCKEEVVSSAVIAFEIGAYGVDAKFVRARAVGVLVRKL